MHGSDHREAPGQRLQEGRVLLQARTTMQEQQRRSGASLKQFNFSLAKLHGLALQTCSNARVVHGDLSRFSLDLSSSRIDAKAMGSRRSDFAFVLCVI